MRTRGLFGRLAGQSRLSRLASYLQASVGVVALLANGAAWAQQLPTGGTVAAGSATIAQPNANTLNINQSTNQAIINWNSFSIGQGGTVSFNQPNSSSATLNRVLGSTPSTIAGTINAPGTVLLVNPNGIAITKSGLINTNSFAASTLDIKDADFLAGNYKFTGNGGSAAVTNAGRINVSDGGFAALMGGQVANSGVISARLGKVGLGAGELITLDFAGDGFLSVAVPSSEVGKLVDQNGALITNSGKIRADLGQVFLTAATASNILRDAVNVPGSIRANTVGTRDGKIVIGGGAGGKVNVTGKLAASGGKKNAGGKVEVSGADVKLAGAVNVSGKTGGTVAAQADQNLSVTGTVAARGRDGKGGEISVTSADVQITGAMLDASGATGGGTILIGGGYQGGGTLARALTTTVDAASVIRADAIVSGDGGKVVVWSDGQTIVGGTFTARGGAQGGNGGLVETSGKENLAVLDTAYVNTLAPNGVTGNWLLDPKNIIVANSGAATLGEALFGSGNDAANITIAVATINAAASNVTLQANNDITISNAVNMTNSVMLTLNAGRSILVNANVTSRGGFTATINDAGANSANRDAGRAAFTMAADTTISTVPTTANTNGGAVSITTGTLAGDSSGATSLAANIGDITLAAINTSGVNGGASSNGAGGSITIINSQGNILSAPTGTVTISANGTTATSGPATGKAGGTVQLTATNGSIGSSVTRLGNISANGGNGIGTNQSGGNGGAVTLIAGTSMWTGAVSTTGGTRSGTGGGAVVGAIGAQSLQAVNGSITMTTGSLSASNLTFSANATTGTVTILSATNSATMTINGNGNVNLTAAVLTAMTANTLAFGSSANTNYVTIGNIPEGSAAGTVTVPGSVKNIILTSGAVDTGWGSVGINGGITGSTANITLNATDAAGSVYLQSGTANTASLTANANSIISANSFFYNNMSSGIVTLNASGVSSFNGTESIALGGAITANTLTLSGPGEIYQQTGAFRVTNLLVTGGTFIDLSGGNNQNQIANFAANTTGRIKLHDNVNLNIASIGGVDGVTANQFNLSFASTNRSVTQSASANITASEFSVVSGGTGTFVVNATLTNAGNSIGTFAAAVTSTGTINLSGTNGLIIGRLVDSQGSQIASGVTAGTLVLSNSGAVTQTQRIATSTTAGTNLLLLGSGDYTLTNTSNLIQTLAGNTTGRINLYDNRALSIGAVTGAAGTVNGVTANALNLQLGTGFTATQTQAITVNSLTLRNSSANNAVTYTLTNAGNSVGSFAASVGTNGVVSLTGTGGLFIGSVLFDGTNFLNGVTAATLTLSNTGSVTQDLSSANRISVTNLALLGAGGSYTLTNDSNSIGTLAANTGSINVSRSAAAALATGTVGSTVGITTTGNVTLSSVGAVTVGAAGAINAGGAVILTTTGAGSVITLGSAVSGVGVTLNSVAALALNSSINGGSGTVSLNVTGAGNAITQTAGAITAGTLALTTNGGNATLDAFGNAVTNLGTVTLGTGAFTFFNDGDLTITGAATAGGGYSVEATGNLIQGAAANINTSSAGGDVYLTACGCSGLELNANINAGTGAVYLLANTITQPAGAIVANTLNVQADTATLNSPSNVFSVINAQIIDNFSATTSVSLTVGDVGVSSLNGSITLTATGAASDINVPFWPGGGRVDGNDITLNAGRDIVVDGGVVLGSDTVSLMADNDITVRNAGLVGGTNVSLDASRDIWVVNGQVGGDIVSLTAGQDIQVSGCGCGGIAGNDVLLAASRDIVVDAMIEAGAAATLLAGRDLTLASSNAFIRSFGSGDAIVLSTARNFINNAGASVLDTSGGSGRWLIYSSNPASITSGGLDSGNAPIWNTSYPTPIAATGNRYVFASAESSQPPTPSSNNNPSQVQPPGNNPTNPGVNIAFQNATGGPINISFTPSPRIASGGPGTDVSPASLPDGATLATNNGMIFLPISQYDANQYSQFTLPGYADQAGLSAVFTMISRGADGQRASSYMIDTFWDGTTGAWKAGDPNLGAKVTFSDGLGNMVAPNGQAGFPVVAGATDFAAMLKTGPVMINGGGNPPHWLLATQMTPDGKGIVANDPATGKQVLLAYDAATKTVGGITGVFDGNTKKFVAVAEAAAATTPADGRLSALQGFVASSYLAVSVK